jgi:hypothetical protein
VAPLLVFMGFGQCLESVKDMMFEIGVEGV